MWLRNIAKCHSVLPMCNCDLGYNTSINERWRIQNRYWIFSNWPSFSSSFLFVPLLIDHDLPWNMVAFPFYITLFFSSVSPYFYIIFRNGRASLDTQPPHSDANLTYSEKHRQNSQVQMHTCIKRIVYPSCQEVRFAGLRQCKVYCRTIWHGCVNAKFVHTHRRGWD